MPTIKRKTDLDANASANPLAGSQYEFLPWPALVEFVILADGADVEASIFSGSDVLLEPTEVDQRAVTDPINVNDDILVQDVVAGGERLGMTIRETGGLGRIVRTVVRITPA